VTPLGNADGCENEEFAEKAIRKNMKTKAGKTTGKYNKAATRRVVAEIPHPLFLQKSVQALENKGQESQKEAQESSRVRKRLKERDLPCCGTRAEAQKSLAEELCRDRMRVLKFRKSNERGMSGDVEVEDSRRSRREQLVKGTVEVQWPGSRGLRVAVSRSAREKAPTVSVGLAASRMKATAFE
jgi:hypothetical protein